MEAKVSEMQVFLFYHFLFIIILIIIIINKHLISGTAGGLVSTLALYPLELIKTRMQVITSSTTTSVASTILSSSSSTATLSSSYNSFPKAALLVYRLEGIRGLYQGNF